MHFSVAAMSHPPAPHPASTLNLRCAGCSYELRGLDPGGRCPECGLEIADTLDANRRRCGRLLLRARRMHGPPLARSDARWLRSTAAGLVALTLVHAALLAWYVAWVRDGSYHRSKTPDYQLFWIAALHAAGLWLLTCRDHNADEQERVKRRPLRWWLRLLAFAAPAAAAMGLVSELVPYQHHSTWARLALLPVPAVAVVVYLTFDWIATLAARVRGRYSVIVFNVTRLLATAFATLMIALGVTSGQRVAEIVASAMDALAVPMPALAAATALMVRLAWKLCAAASVAPAATTTAPLTAGAVPAAR